MSQLARFHTLLQKLRETDPLPKPQGKVTEIGNMLARVAGLQANIGDIAWLNDPVSARTLWAEVVGVSNRQTLLMPFGNNTGLSSLTQVRLRPHQYALPAASQLLGRVLDGLGRPLDAQALPHPAADHATHNANRVLNPLERAFIDTPFVTGIRAVDGLLSCGVGQRVGIIAPAGVGKSTLTGMIARWGKADAVVVALIGERGREVREFVEHQLGNRIKSSIVIAATAERPAAERIRAAETASLLAESLRDEGQQVLLIFDSLTRYARALRELGLALGEPPARRGYPPSTFTRLPQLLERAGRTAGSGAITGFYTVLAEDEDANDPISEEARSLLDGHIQLSPDLAQAGHFPAIDILKSNSRVMNSLASKAQRHCATRVREWLALYKESELLVRLGEYQPGSDPQTDTALARHPAIALFLQQSATAQSSWEETLSQLEELIKLS
ncbi:FliI/YscN family ATPase [Paraburkholderia hayleyella]|uniref:FliI/YscN family ATPase n=1 Tax=Paraburkholderia hayleyella TaxID=2152889 RepID=UPI0012924962|nr:FliI/YscN family ATPase [Paraburkholderia hayleyella]